MDGANGLFLRAATASTSALQTRPRSPLTRHSNKLTPNSSANLRATGVALIWLSSPSFTTVLAVLLVRINSPPAAVTAFSRSLLDTRPWRPVPEILFRFTPYSIAKRRATGEAETLLSSTPSASDFESVRPGARTELAPAKTPPASVITDSRSLLDTRPWRPVPEILFKFTPYSSARRRATGEAATALSSSPSARVAIAVASLDTIAAIGAIGAASAISCAGSATAGAGSCTTGAGCASLATVPAERLAINALISSSLVSADASTPRRSPTAQVSPGSATIALSMPLSGEVTVLTILLVSTSIKSSPTLI